MGDKLVINPGSVGLPRDGDPRASYAVIENYKVDLKRVEYPVEDAVSVIQAGALPEMAKEMWAEVLRTGAAVNGGVRTSFPGPSQDVPHGEELPANSRNGDQPIPSESIKEE